MSDYTPVTHPVTRITVTAGLLVAYAMGFKWVLSMAPGLPLDAVLPAGAILTIAAWVAIYALGVIWRER